MSAISLQQLSFGYSKKALVLNDINLHVPEGSIYGFLGANGAGKTTTLRLILGLLRARKGRISVLGKDISDSYPALRARIGSLIEHTSHYGHLSARDNLRIWSKYWNIPSRRIDEVLDLVSLSDARNKKTQAFSTGMKQRLGLASALLHDPDLLILDEPTNGLDPMGIIDLRESLHRLQATGKTILLSSHILSEVEKLVSMIGILKDGKVVFEGSLRQLQELKHQNLKIRLRVNDLPTAMDLISKEFNPQLQEGHILLSIHKEQHLAHLIRELVEAGLDVYEASPQDGNLENLFLSIANTQ